MTVSLRDKIRLKDLETLKSEKSKVNLKLLKAEFKIGSFRGNKQIAIITGLT